MRNLIFVAFLLLFISACNKEKDNKQDMKAPVVLGYKYPQTVLHVWGSPSCSPCRAVKKWCKENKVRFRYHEEGTESFVPFPVEHDRYPICALVQPDGKVVAHVDGYCQCIGLYGG